MAQITTGSFQIVTFRLQDKQTNELYAIPIKQVREIRLVESITNIPNTKQHVKGIMNLRGQIIPIIDAKEKLGMILKSGVTEKQRILIIEVDRFLAGLLVDEVDQVLNIRHDDVQKVSAEMSESLNHSEIVTLKDQMLILLDANTFIEYFDEATSN